jgi:hypothetical protein
MCSVILLQEMSSSANSHDLPSQGIVPVLPSLKIGNEARGNWLQVTQRLMIPNPPKQTSVHATALSLRLRTSIVQLISIKPMVPNNCGNVYINVAGFTEWITCKVIFNGKKYKIYINYIFKVLQYDSTFTLKF